MRAAAPWLGSLFLHSLFLLGIIILTRTPPELPQTLTLDFQLIAPAIAEPAAVAPPAAPDKPVVSKPVERKPPPQEKSPQPVEPVAPPAPVATISELPPPVEELPAVEPVTEPAPIIKPQSVADEVFPPVENQLAETESKAIERPVNAITARVGDIESEAVAGERQARTISHIRKQVLGTLSYPAVARRKGWSGRLLVGFVLCADGTVEDLEVVESSGYRILDRAALQAVAANVPFKGGYPRTEVRLPINFELN